MATLRAQTTPGAIWVPASRLADAARDVRASQIDDLLTVVVAEQASAVTTGQPRPSGRPAPRQCDGGGGDHETARRCGEPRRVCPATRSWRGRARPAAALTLRTTLTARVVYVLPNGTLVVEATKDIQINSERQTITLRGMVRPQDIDNTNSVAPTASDSSKFGSTARAWSATPFDGRSSSTASSWDCFLSEL